MEYKKLYIFDADQFCLRKNIKPNEINQNCLIAASNNPTNIQINGKSYGQCVPMTPQSADNFLVNRLQTFCRKHTADHIFIVTRDKRLVQRLVSVIPIGQLKRVKAHPCCQYETNHCLNTAKQKCRSTQSTYHNLSKFEQNVKEHIAEYPKGLKLKNVDQALFLHGKEK